jgi:hypothetical protein
MLRALVVTMEMLVGERDLIVSRCRCNALLDCATRSIEIAVHVDVQLR